MWVLSERKEHTSCSGVCGSNSYVYQLWHDIRMLINTALTDFHLSIEKLIQDYKNIFGLIIWTFVFLLGFFFLKAKLPKAFLDSLEERVFLHYLSLFLDSNILALYLFHFMLLFHCLLIPWTPIPSVPKYGHGHSLQLSLCALGELKVWTREMQRVWLGFPEPVQKLQP